MSEKCESCRRGLNGQNGNGYMPCSCNKEAKPLYVEPPPLVPIGRPRLGWKPKPFNLDPYANFNKLLLIIMMVCLIVASFVMGCAYAASHVP